MITTHFQFPRIALPFILLLGGCTSLPTIISDEQTPTPLPASTSTDANLGSLTTPNTSPSIEPTTTIATGTPTLAATLSTVTAEPAQPILAVTPATEVEALQDTLLLYTNLANLRIAPTLSMDVMPDDYWAFRTVPSLPFLDPTIFDRLYGKYQYADDMSLYFLDFRPRPSPNSRYLLVPGVAGIPEAGIEGMGLWLIDLNKGTSRELLPKGIIANWSPASDAIAYVQDDTLYTLNLDEGAAPQPVFSHEDLWTGYAHWSPNGEWIATLTSSLEGTNEYETGYAATYWLVPSGGGVAKELTTQTAEAIEYCSCDISWSPNGQYLLVRNKVFDLEGNMLLSDYPGALTWIPNESHLLVNAQGELQIVSVSGEVIAHIADIQYPATWAWSRDGRRLAYSPGREKGGTDAEIIIYDLDQGENQVVGIIPGANSVELLRWSADNSKVIVGLDRENRDEIWIVAGQPGGETKPLMESALLIEAVSYPVR